MNRRKWAEGIANKDKGYFEHLASGQSPDFLWIGCSDSRAPVRVLSIEPPQNTTANRLSWRIILC